MKAPIVARQMRLNLCSAHTCCATHGDQTLRTLTNEAVAHHASPTPTVPTTIFASITCAIV